MGNWFSDMYGEDAFERMIEEVTEKGLWDVNKQGEKYRVRVIQQDNTLIIDLYERKTGKGIDRIFPFGGFTPEQRETIAEQALAYAEQEHPIMWEKILSPMMDGYWDSEEWDVVKVHNLDKRISSTTYRNFLR